MPKVPLRERIFYHSCFVIGKIGRFFGYKLRNPVFIIGTGRCGTTLLVRILNSHPRLSGFPGEANEIWHPKLQPFESAAIDVPPIEVDPELFSEISVSNWNPDHGEKIRDIFTGFHLITGTSKIFFTKSAEISFLIPTILSIFPDARFIHIYRFGPSVVESYFKKNFGKYSRYKFTDQEYRYICAKYWNACIMEIATRKRELIQATNSQFLEFSYENLCQNPREIIEDISRFIGVDSECFSFDISQISNQNIKIADYSKNPEGIALLEVMSQGMKLKGYLPDYYLG